MRDGAPIPPMPQRESSNFLSPAAPSKLPKTNGKLGVSDKTHNLQLADNPASHDGCSRCGPHARRREGRDCRCCQRHPEHPVDRLRRRVFGNVGVGAVPPEGHREDGLHLEYEIPRIRPRGKRREVSLLAHPCDALHQHVAHPLDLRQLFIRMTATNAPPHHAAHAKGRTFRYTLRVCSNPGAFVFRR